MSMIVDVCLTSENKKDQMSTLISAAMAREFTHCLIRFYDEGVWKILHCIEKGVCVEDAKEFYKTHYDVRSLRVELDCTFEEFKILTVAWNGVEYSESQYVNCALDKLGLGFIHFSDNEESKMICSELVARVLHKWSKFKFTEDMDRICPVDIEAVLFSN